MGNKIFCDAKTRKGTPCLCKAMTSLCHADLEAREYFLHRERRRRHFRPLRPLTWDPSMMFMHRENKA